MVFVFAMTVGSVTFGRVITIDEEARLEDKISKEEEKERVAKMESSKAYDDLLAILINYKQEDGPRTIWAKCQLKVQKEKDGFIIYDGKCVLYHYTFIEGDSEYMLDGKYMARGRMKDTEEFYKKHKISFESSQLTLEEQEIFEDIVSGKRSGSIRREDSKLIITIDEEEKELHEEF